MKKQMKPFDEHAFTVVEYIDACIEACGRHETAKDRDFCALAANIVRFHHDALMAYCQIKRNEG